MTTTPGLPDKPANPRELLKNAGLFAKKSWGQNFLCDQTVLSDIAAAAGAGPECPVVELGAGTGALTYQLLKRGGRVVAVERDRDIVPVLASYLGACETLRIEQANAATLDYAALAEQLGTASVTVVGNIPYQLSGRILVELADASRVIDRAVLLVQREVGERVAAGPGSRDFGLLSVLVQRAFSVELLRIVPPGAFHPPPKVHSAVVRLQRLASRYDETRDAHLCAAARAAFSARRKTLKNALRGGLALNATTRIATASATATTATTSTDVAQSLTAALLSAGIAADVRAETLGIEEFARLGDALAAAGLI